MRKQNSTSARAKRLAVLRARAAKIAAEIRKLEGRSRLKALPTPVAKPSNVVPIFAEDRMNARLLELRLAEFRAKMSPEREIAACAMVASQ
jgi:hypothetical protein